MLISVKPRRIHVWAQEFNFQPNDANTGLYSRIREETRLIERELRRKKPFAVDIRPANNCCATDLADSSRNRHIRAELKKIKTVGEKLKRADVDEFMAERNMYRLAVW